MAVWRAWRLFCSISTEARSFTSNLAARMSLPLGNKRQWSSSNDAGIVRRFAVEGNIGKSQCSIHSEKL